VNLGEKLWETTKYTKGAKEKKEAYTVIEKPFFKSKGPVLHFDFHFVKTPSVV